MLDVGQHIGNYVVRSLLGEGGMGRVYLAEHPLIGKRVAIKVIHPSMARNADTVSRFFTEAQAVNRIGHPNIVDITDYGSTASGESYFVMEYLTGESLGARVKRGKLAIPEALHIVQQVADALAASHAVGILHRDLKPDNIYLVPRGGLEGPFVKVLDFGLAKLTSLQDHVSHRTRTGSVMGTPYYMAPEQCAGKSDIDARADVYALGVILYEMLTGTVPFGGEGYGEVIVKHMTEPAPRAAGRRPDVPQWLDELVARTMAKERKERVQSMEELRDTITSCLEGGLLPQPRKAGAPSLIATPTRRPGRNLKLFVAGAAVAAVGVAVAAVSMSERPPGLAAVPDAAAVAVATPLVAVTPPVAQPPDAAAAVAPTPPVVPPAPAKIIIHLESDPAGAIIVLADGTELGRTPLEWAVDPSESMVEVSFRKDGHDTRTRQISLRQSSSVVVDLPRARGTRPNRPTPPTPDPTVKPPVEATPTPPKPPDDDLMPPPGN